MVGEADAAAAQTSWTRFEEERRPGSGGVILRLSRGQGYGVETGTVLDRFTRAAEWALDLDAQYSDLLAAGRNPLVVVPAGGIVARGGSNERLSLRTVGYS